MSSIGSGVSYIAIPSFTGGRTSPTTYWPPNTILPSGSTGAMTANRLYYLPAIYPGLTIDRMQFSVVTTAAGQMRIGIYANNSGIPGNLIVDIGTASVSSTGVFDLSFSAQTLPNDFVWFTAHFDATPGMLIGSQMLVAAGASTISTSTRGLIATTTYGAFSAVANLTSLTFTSSPMPLLVVWKS